MAGSTSHKNWFERLRAWWARFLAALPEYERRNLHESRDRGMRRAERELGLRNMELKFPTHRGTEQERIPSKGHSEPHRDSTL